MVDAGGSSTNALCCTFARLWIVTSAKRSCSRCCAATSTAGSDPERHANRCRCISLPVRLPHSPVSAAAAVLDIAIRDHVCTMAIKQAHYSTLLARGKLPSTFMQTHRPAASVRAAARPGLVT